MIRAALVFCALLLPCCDDVAPGPEPDAGVVADPPTEPPPGACLPWPCGSVGVPLDAAVAGRDPQEGGASVPPWHLDAGAP